MTVHAAEKSLELCVGITESRAKTETIVGYIARTVLYDFIKARTVQPDYRPDPDKTLATKRGICWDIAMLVAAMLLAVDVQCQVVIGWADKEYHAWNEVFLDKSWVRYDVTSMITGISYMVYKPEKRRRGKK